MGLKPSHIGRFRLIRRVGSGGMGVVYEAEDGRDGARVALKALLPHAQDEPEGLLRFKREFRALARLRHQNIVRVIDAGIEDDVAFIVMAFIDGVNVRKYLNALPVGRARDARLRGVLEQIFGALAHVHARRIIHRDLKPENMLVDETGRVTIMDFGVARMQRTPTNSPGLLGTFAYMAPEQMMGAELDGRADLYAVGVLMYEALTGDYPFPVEPPAAALHHHTNTIPAPVLERRPGADPRLAELTMQLLEKDPQQRLPNAEAAIAFLNHREDSKLPVPRPKTEPGMLFSPRFAGREAEFKVLTQLAEDAELGRGRLLLLDGAVGSGKRRILSELSSQLRGRFHVLRANCPAERPQAYAPFSELLDQVEAICRRSPPAQRSRILGADAALVAAISPQLAKLSPDSGQASDLDHPQRKLRLHKAVIGVIGRLALVRPVLLVVEDIHWADTATRELLWDTVGTLLAPRPGEAALTVCPVAMLWSRRLLAEGPDLSASLTDRIADRGLLSTLSLGPLEAEGVARMVRAMSGVADTPADAQIVEDLLQDAQGQPLMVRELMESWVQDGTLSRLDGRWRYRGRALDSRPNRPATPTAGGGPALMRGRPPQPEDVLRAKVQRLSEDAGRILERVALMGRLLPSPIVARISDLPEAAFLDAMDELVRSGLLLEEVGPRAMQYRFQHESFRDSLVRQLGSERRRAQHRFIGLRVEAGFRSRHRELAHLLARHFQGAGCPVRSVRYLRMMAEDAGARGDLAAAARRLKEAQQILEDSPPGVAAETRRLRLALTEIDLLLAFGRGKEALARARPEASSRARDPGLMRDELRLRQAASYAALGQMEDCLQSLGQMRERPYTLSLSARALLLRGRSFLSLGRFGEADRALARGYELAIGARDYALAQRIDERLALVLSNKGSHARALRKLTKSLHRARRRKDLRQAAWLIGQIGLVRAAQGEDSAALDALRQAVALAEQRKVSVDLARWSGELGVLLSELGRGEEAERNLSQALALAEAGKLGRAEIRWRGELGAHQARQGQLGAAERALERCLSQSRDAGYRSFEAFALIQLGGLGAIQAGPERAEALVNEGLALAEALHQRRLLVMAWRARAGVAQAAGRPAEAAQAERTAADLATRSHDARLLRDPR